MFLTSKSDKYLISDYNITINPTKIMKIQEMIPTQDALDCYTNSLCIYHRKIIENSKKSMHSDVKM